MSIPESMAHHQKYVNDLYTSFAEQTVFAGMIGPRPRPTRWQRFKWRIADCGDRLTNAWLALRGEWPDE